MFRIQSNLGPQKLPKVDKKCNFYSKSTLFIEISIKIGQKMTFFTKNKPKKALF